MLLALCTRYTVMHCCIHCAYGILLCLHTAIQHMSAVIQQMALKSTFVRNIELFRPINQETWLVVPADTKKSDTVVVPVMRGLCFDDYFEILKK